MLKLLNMAGVLITLALIEYIQAPITPSLVKLFAVEKSREVGAFHSMESSVSWVVIVRARVVTAKAS